MGAYAMPKHEAVGATEREEDIARQPAAPRILIVDDDENVLIRLEAILEDLGCHTETFWNGRDALEALSRQSFDLILVDDYLPDLDFREIIRKGRAQDAKVIVTH